MYYVYGREVFELNKYNWSPRQILRPTNVLVPWSGQGKVWICGSLTISLKRPSLLRETLKFIDEIDFWGQFYQTFFDHKLQMFVISQSVFRCQAFPA